MQVGHKPKLSEELWRPICVSSEDNEDKIRKSLPNPYELSQAELSKSGIGNLYPSAAGKDFLLERYSSDTLISLGNQSSYAAVLVDKIKTAIKVFEKVSNREYMSIQDSSFSSLYQGYKQILKWASKEEGNVFQEIIRLSELVSVCGGRAKPISLDVKARLDEIGVNLENIVVLEDSYEKSQLWKKQTLTFLTVEWTNLVSNLQQAYQLLIRYESLCTSIEKTPSDRECIEKVVLGTPPDKTPLETKLAVLKASALSADEVAKTLIMTSKFGKNSGKHIQDCKNAVLALRKIEGEVLDLEKTVREAVAGISASYKSGKGAPLNSRAWNTLEKYLSGSEVNNLKEAELRHLTLQKDKKNEIVNIKETWDTISKIMKDTCNTINTVIAASKQPENVLRKITVNASPFDSPEKALEVRAHIFARECAGLQWRVEDLIAKAKNNKPWVSFCASPAAKKEIQDGYAESYEDYSNLLKSNEILKPKLEERLAKINRSIEFYKILSVSVDDLKKFYEKCPQEEKEVFLMQAREFHEIHPKFTKELKDLIDESSSLQDALNECNESFRTSCERLCRLAQAYETGYIPTQLSVDYLRAAQTYEIPPNPAALSTSVIQEKI